MYIYIYTLYLAHIRHIKLKQWHDLSHRSALAIIYCLCNRRLHGGTHQHFTIGTLAGFGEDDVLVGLRLGLPSAARADPR